MTSPALPPTRHRPPRGGLLSPPAPHDELLRFVRLHDRQRVAAQQFLVEGISEDASVHVARHGQPGRVEDRRYDVLRVRGLGVVAMRDAGADDQHEAVIGVSLKPDAPAVTEALKEQVRHDLKKALPDVSVSFEAADIISQVMSFGSPTPIEVAVQGPALPATRAFAEKIKVELAKIDSLRDLQYAQPLDYPSQKRFPTNLHETFGQVCRYGSQTNTLAA